MYVRGTSLSEVRAILRLVPFNVGAAALVLVGGALGGDVQWALWAFAAALLWFTPWFTSTEGFVIAAEHFVERHGLVIIVALGESIVVIGAAASLELDLGLAVVVLLALALSASFWWLYFSDEGAVERAMVERAGRAPPTARADRVRLLALRAPAGDRRRGRGAQEGGRRPVRPARDVGRAGARGGHGALHRQRGRLQAHARDREERHSARRRRSPRLRRSHSAPRSRRRRRWEPWRRSSCSRSPPRARRFRL